MPTALLRCCAGHGCWTRSSARRRRLLRQTSTPTWQHPLLKLRRRFGPRLEAHRDKPACKQCHGVIDPTGLALENFDAIGRYRTTDRQAGNQKIDASTVMPNGVAIDGPVQLRQELVKSPEKFVTAMTERLMMYAINRQLEHFDMPQVRRVVRNAEKENYTLTSLVLGIVNTDAFRKQGPEAVSKAAPKPRRSRSSPGEKVGSRRRTCSSPRSTFPGEPS